LFPVRIAARRTPRRCDRTAGLHGLVMAAGGAGVMPCLEGVGTCLLGCRTEVAGHNATRE